MPICCFCRYNNLILQGKFGYHQTEHFRSRLRMRDLEFCMTIMKNVTFRPVLSLLLLVSFITATLPQVGYAQNATAVQTGQYDKGLAEIESKVDARRKELGIPGMSLVIVKDGQVIFMKGLGFKDYENKVAVTPDTQFAIGSATKAFTALSVLRCV